MCRTVLSVIAVLLLISFCACGKTVNDGYSGAVIAVEINSDGELAAQSFVGEGAVVDTYNDVADAALAVENGKADYIVTDEFAAANFAAAGRKLVKYEDCAYKTELHAVFCDEKMRDEFNASLEALVSNGSYEKIKSCALNGEKHNVSGGSYENGTLKILCDPSFATLMRVGDDGTLAGIEVDLAHAILAEMGYQAEFVQCDFDEMFTMLENGDGDLIMSSVTYTAERAESYLFSSPYLTVNYVVLERGKQ